MEIFQEEDLKLRYYPILKSIFSEEIFENSVFVSRPFFNCLFLERDACGSIKKETRVRESSANFFQIMTSGLAWYSSIVAGGRRPRFVILVREFCKTDEGVF